MLHVLVVHVDVSGSEFQLISMSPRVEVWSPDTGFFDFGGASRDP